MICPPPSLLQCVRCKGPIQCCGLNIVYRIGYYMFLLPLIGFRHVIRRLSQPISVGGGTRPPSPCWTNPQLSANPVCPDLFFFSFCVYSLSRPVLHLFIEMMHLYIFFETNSESGLAIALSLNVTERMLTHLIYSGKIAARMKWFF